MKKKQNKDGPLAKSKNLLRSILKCQVTSQVPLIDWLPAQMDTDACHAQFMKNNKQAW